MLKAALDEAFGEAERKPASDGFIDLPEGRRLTLHTAHDGVGLTVSKVDRIAQSAGGVVRARNERGEIFVLALEDLFALSVEGSRQGGAGAPRRAGFLG